MNVLFLTLLSFDSLQERSIYTDLLREFVKNGHHVYAISPTEKRQNRETHLIKEDNVTILRLQIGNTQKTNIIEKGISTVMIEPTFKKAIKKYFSDVRFDLVLYSTPPITLVSAIEYVKKRDRAKTYLLLKDIFPQNAVDMCMLSKTGIKGLIYKHFRKQEKRLYSISDRIGCMSQANVDYVINHNSEVDPKIVEICPNCVEPLDMSTTTEIRDGMRQKYGLPLDKIIYVYGGNLGKPQGISFLIDCMRGQMNNTDAYFLIVGDGTEFSKLEGFINAEKPKNVKLMKRLPKEDYDHMVAACDVGLIFLDYRFTIPNFPSRLLSYMQAKLPVLCVTDSSTDIGKVVVENNFGWCCRSDDTDAFNRAIVDSCESNLHEMGCQAWRCLNKLYSVSRGYQIIESVLGEMK